MLTKDLAQKMAQIAFTDEEFKDCMQQEVGYLQTLFKKEKQMGLTPMIHVFFRINFKAPIQQIVIALAGSGDFFEGENKQKTMMALGVKFWQDNEAMTGHADNKIYPLCVVMSSEAWLRQSSAEEEKTRSKPVSEFDDKKEAIIIQGMTIDRRVSQTTYLLKRREDSSILPVEEIYASATSDDVKEMRAYLLEDFYRGFVETMHRDTKYMESMLGKD